jgi:hypothetical protein
MDVKKIKGLPNDAKVGIVISGLFYKDLQQSFLNLLQDGETKETVGKILDNLHSKTITSPKEYALFTMYSVIGEVERQAKANNLIVEYDMPTESSPEN